MRENCDEWKKIPGYPLYEANRAGQIRRDGRVLKPYYTRSNSNPVGYAVVRLYKGDGQSKRLKVARVIAGMFIPNQEGLSEVNHKDCDVTNNSVDNLEWTSRAQNIAHAVKNGKVSKGRKGKRAITPQDVRRIIELHERGATIREICEEVGFGRTVIGYVKNGTHQLVKGSSTIPTGSTAQAGGKSETAS